MAKTQWIFIRNVVADIPPQPLSAAHLLVEHILRVVSTCSMFCSAAVVSWKNGHNGEAGNAIGTNIGDH